MPQERPKKSSRVILSIPLTPDHKADLELRAGAKPLSLYAREILFPANDNARIGRRSARQSFSRKARQDSAALLAKLGQSEMGASLRDLHLLAKLGALPFTPETEAAIQQACADIADMKSMLMKALAVREW